MQDFWNDTFLQMPDSAKLLFDQMPRFMYFVKDRDFRFVRINQQLADKIGHAEEEIIGKTDYDFFPVSMADAFRKDDEQILTTKESILNKVELVPSSHGQVDWSITTKVPLLDDDQNVMAILGVTRAFSSSITAMGSSSEINKVTALIKKNFADKLSIEDLAKQASLSVSALERKFKAVFHVSPSQYILNTSSIHASRTPATYSLRALRIWQVLPSSVVSMIRVILAISFPNP